jgi:hypothetical protein
MPTDLKQAILQNPFLEKLRNEVVVDGKAFEALCQSLTELERDWKSATSIDKELVQELYVLAPVTKNMADSLASHRPDLARELAEMAVRLDALVLNCLAS